MFITVTQSGYIGTTQIASGLFLIVFDRGRELRACVRKVRLTQFGHWMMGHANILGHKETLSGDFGGENSNETLRRPERRSPARATGPRTGRA